MKIDVGRLGVPAGGLRTFWTNGLSVFCIFDKAWNRREEGRRGRTQATGRCGRRRSDDKIPEYRILLNGPCVFCIFDDAVTCSGASVPENVQKPPRLCTKVGSLTEIDGRFRNDRVGIFRRSWPLGRGPNQRRNRLKSI